MRLGRAARAGARGWPPPHEAVGLDSGDACALEVLPLELREVPDGFHPEPLQLHNGVLRDVHLTTQVFVHLAADDDSLIDAAGNAASASCGSDRRAMAVILNVKSIGAAAGPLIIICSGGSSAARFQISFVPRYQMFNYGQQRYATPQIEQRHFVRRIL